METKLINITEIKPYWRNPRNNEGAIQAVAQSIKDYGFNYPLILDKENVIIAGHTRYKALQLLGVEQVPCVIKDDLTAQQIREYRIADNKTSELSTWDMDKLIPELRELKAVEDMEIYFPTISLEDLIAEQAGAHKFTNPTQENIGKIEERMQMTFEDRSKVQQSAYVEVICPHCTEAFHVDRNEIARARDDS
jgi:site-specific DNA-methyltransferase (adenine-specific)